MEDKFIFDFSDNILALINLNQSSQKKTLVKILFLYCLFPILWLRKRQQFDRYSVFQSHQF